MNKETWTEIIENGAYSYELDWVAVDSSGQIGVFSAIMNAPIPIEVGNSYELYSELKNIIDQLSESSEVERVTTNSGNFSEWFSYSKKGLYAFDFQDVHRAENEKLNQYDLISKPTRPIYLKELKLNKDVQTIIPKIDCNFKDGNILNEKIKTAYIKK